MRRRIRQAAVTVMLTGGLEGASALAEPAPLVFIHGIKGGVLKSSDGEVKWLTAWQALGISTPSLALAARFEGGAQPRDDLKADGVLEQISLIPWLYAVDVYKPWLDQAGKLGRAFHPFAYDWRRDNRETVLAFESFLEGLKSKTGQSADVVAHSMGGLITMSLINKRPDLVRRVVFAGVPFKGGISFLPDLHVGESTGLNSEIVGRDVLATYPSIFSLFPLANSHLLNADGTVAAMDFYDASSWEKNSVGPFHPGHSKSDDYRAFLRQALAFGKEFREGVAAQWNKVYPRALVVMSKAHKTVTKAILGGPKSELGVDFTSPAPVDGDGRVAFQTALPPDGVSHEVFLTDNDHVSLLDDPKVALKIRAFLDQP